MTTPYISSATKDYDDERYVWTRSTIRMFDLHGTDLGRVVAFAGNEAVEEIPIRVVTDRDRNVYTLTWRLEPSLTLFTQSEYTEQPMEFAQPVLTLMLRIFDPTGTLLVAGTLGPPGNAFPDLEISADGRLLYVSDPINRQVLIYERLP